MAPCASRVKAIPAHKTHAALFVEEVAAHYHAHVSPSTEEVMHPLEEEIKIIKAYQDDRNINQ
jgi:hypothetical protein